MKNSDLIKELTNKLSLARTKNEHWVSLARLDLSFFHGDTFNKAQWGQDSIQPQLTINKTAQHVLNIENKARQYRMGIKVNPYGYGAENTAAEAMEGLIRHILNTNNAQQNAIMNAIEWQVRTGLGWIELTTDYVNQDSFDKDFVIKPLRDSTKVYPDPDVKELDYSDMRYCFIEDEIPRDIYIGKYKKDDDDESDNLEWGDNNRDIKIIRCYLKKYISDVLYMVPMSIGGFKLVKKSELPPEIKSEFLKQARELKYRKRKIFTPQVWHYVLKDEEILESRLTPFSYIPMIAFVGIENRTDHLIDRYGIVRPLRDPQTMLNIAMSEIVEQVHLQPKARFLAPFDSIEGFYKFWQEGNISKRVILPYNAHDKQGQALPAPTRLEPPMISEGLAEIVKSCTLFMEGVTGQTDVQMTESQAIVTNSTMAEAKERVTLTATYHYTDNQARALKLLGTILLESIPKVYNTNRVLECSLDYGFTKKIVIDLSLESATDSQGQMLRTTDAETPIRVNPAVGKYNAVSDIGVNYETERQKAFDGIYMLIQTCPTLAPTLIPYLLKASDYPLAQEMAIKLEAEPPPEVAELQEKIGKLTQINQELELEKRDKSMDYELRQQDLLLRKEKQEYEKQVAQMDQETKRRKQSTDAIAAMGSINPEIVEPVLQETVTQFEKQLASPYGTPPETIMTDPTQKSIDSSVENETDSLGDFKRLHSLNPPGGPIHEPNPVIGAIKE